MTGRFGDFAINRLFTNTFSCVSVRFLSSTSLLCLALEASPPPFHDPCRLACRVFLRSHHRSRSFLRSDSLVHVLLVPLWDLMHHLRFSSAEFCKSSYTSRTHYSIICSDKVFVCEVALSQPHAGFPSVFQLWCWISRSLSDLWKICKNCFSKLHQFSTVRSAHGTIEWDCTSLPRKRGMSHAACRTIHLISALSADGLSCVCVLALLPALFALVPATVSDSFRLLHCFDVTVWEKFE